MNKLLAAKLWVCAACRANGSCARISRTSGMKSGIIQRAFVHAVDKQSGEEFVDAHAKFCISHAKISPRYATDEVKKCDRTKFCTNNFSFRARTL